MGNFVKETKHCCCLHFSVSTHVVHVYARILKTIRSSYGLFRLLIMTFQKHDDNSTCLEHISGYWIDLEQVVFNHNTQCLMYSIWNETLLNTCSNIDVLFYVLVLGQICLRATFCMFATLILAHMKQITWVSSWIMTFDLKW